MNNVGMAGAVALVGVGLITIGLGNFVNTPQAVAAAPAVVVEAGPEEATIVWYGNQGGGNSGLVLRAWSNGLIEGMQFQTNYYQGDCVVSGFDCYGTWVVLSSPTEGMSAAADINFDEIVDGTDLTYLLAAWGDAPRNPMPPSDCPLGLLNP